MKNIDVEKLKALKDAKNLTIKQLADKAGLAEGVAAKIFSGINDNPTVETLKKLAAALDCIVDDFLVQEKEYYSDTKTAKLAQELYENPDYRILFDATRDLSPEDLRAVIDIANRIKGTNNNGNNG